MNTVFGSEVIWIIVDEEQSIQIYSLEEFKNKIYDYLDDEYIDEEKIVSDTSLQSRFSRFTIVGHLSNMLLDQIIKDLIQYIYSSAFYIVFKENERRPAEVSSLLEIFSQDDIFKSWGKIRHNDPEFIHKVVNFIIEKIIEDQKSVEEKQEKDKIDKLVNNYENMSVLQQNRFLEQIGKSKE